MVKPTELAFVSKIVFYESRGQATVSYSWPHPDNEESKV